MHCTFESSYMSLNGKKSKNNDNSFIIYTWSNQHFEYYSIFLLYDYLVDKIINQSKSALV